MILVRLPALLGTAGRHYSYRGTVNLATPKQSFLTTTEGNLQQAIAPISIVRDHRHLGITFIREHLISSQFFSKRNAFQIGFTPLPPPSIRKAYRTFSRSDNNRCRLSSRPRLSTTKLLPAGLLSFSSREASADNIISTSSSFSHKFPVSLHASSALRLASFRGRPGLQAT